MARHAANARPRPLVPDEAGASAVILPTVGRHHPIGHGARAAAKHTPSRVTSRMYTRVRTNADALEDLTVAVRDAHLSDAARAGLLAKVQLTGKDLAGAREGIARAAHDRGAADDVKAELTRITTLVATLPVAVKALTRLHRTAKGASSGVDRAAALVTEDDLLHTVEHGTCAELLVAAHAALEASTSSQAA